MTFLGFPKKQVSQFRLNSFMHRLLFDVVADGIVIVFDGGNLELIKSIFFKYFIQSFISY